MRHLSKRASAAFFMNKFNPVTCFARSIAIVAFLALSLCANAKSQTLSTFPGLNTTVKGVNPSATPDVTIAVGTIEYCEHVNSGYQCWYKNGTNANQPVNFLGSTNPKTDSGPWSQNSDNGGATPNCPTAFSPNSQLLHDNVYNLWIMEKRITSKLKQRGRCFFSVICLVCLRIQPR